MTPLRIRELVSDDEIRTAFEVVQELRPHLSIETFTELLSTMRPAGYRLFAALEDNDVVAVAGIGFGTNLYYGSYLWIYDLVTTARARSRGHGKALLDHLEQMAREHGCDTIALSSGLQRRDAHRFYEEKVGFTKASYAFTKPLKGKAFAPAPDPEAS